MDRSRIETHIKPLLGPRLVSNLTLREVEAMQADIAAGKSARGKKAQGRGGRSTGGAGVAARAISTFRALLGHATRLGLIEKNPASGVRQMASRKVKRRLSADEVRHFGKVMRQLTTNGEHPTGLGAIRLMLLTGFRRMEALSLQRAWLNRQQHAIHFPDTKSGEQLRRGRRLGDRVHRKPARPGAFALRVPRRCRGWAFHRCRSSARSGLRQGETGPGVTPHVLRRHLCQHRGRSGIFRADDRWIAGPLIARRHAEVCPSRCGPCRRR